MGNIIWLIRSKKSSRSNSWSEQEERHTSSPPTFYFHSCCRTWIQNVSFLHLSTSASGWLGFCVAFLSITEVKCHKVNIPGWVRVLFQSGLSSPWDSPFWNARDCPRSSYAVNGRASAGTAAHTHMLGLLTRPSCSSERQCCINTGTCEVYLGTLSYLRQA